jgi:hypothetical protein
MASRRRERERRAGRRDAFRNRKPLVLVVSEGAVTEPQYILGFQRRYHDSVVKVLISREHGVPMTVVEIAKRHKQDAEDAAKRERDRNLAYDSVWCMFDVDDHPSVSNARQMASANGIELAISNPCIELWLLLHFRDCPGMQHRQTINDMLKDHIPDYDKSIAFEMFEPTWQEAARRARQMDQLAEDISDPGRNPSTGVYRLVEAIGQTN